jgi:hypothetical protein
MKADVTGSLLPFIAGHVVSVLVAGFALLASFLFVAATGLLQFRHVQIMTFEPYNPVRWSFHLLGATVEASQPLFWLLCFFLILPSLVLGVAGGRYFAGRWRRNP